MVALATPAARDEILSAHVRNISNLLLGTALYGQTVSLTQKSDATSYANYFGNLDTTAGKAVQIQYGTTAIAQFSKAQIYLSQGLTVLQTTPTAAPGTTLSALYPRASDGRWSSRIGAAGTENALAYTSESVGAAITAAGDLIVGSGPSAATNLPIGTARQQLNVNAGATAPTWTSSPHSLMTGTGDLLISSAANTPARLAIGAANQMLVVNPGATSPQWTASPQGTMIGTGDLLTTSAASTLARLLLGTTNHMLAVNGTTGPAWTASPVSVLSGTGDLLYSSAASTLARLALGTTSTMLVASGTTGPVWTASPLSVMTGIGDLLYSSAASTLARLAIGTTSHMLVVNGTTGPAWTASPISLMTATGDILYASAANTPARLAIGATSTMLVVNGTTGPSWTASPISVMTGKGDLLTTSTANTLSRLGIGTTNHMLTASGTTGPIWTASPLSVMTGTGDILYMAASNVLTRLAIGTAGQALVVNPGATAPQWTTNTVTHNQGTRAVGATSSPTITATTYVDMPDMACTLTTTGGDLLVMFTGSLYNSTSGLTTSIAVSLDGAAEVGDVDQTCITGSFPQPFALVYPFQSVSATAHTVKVRWKTSGSTAVAYQTKRTMTLVEL
jgi:hypothetical protein